MKNPHRDYGTKQSFASRLQVLAKSWQTIYEPTLKHEQKMLKLWASGFYDGAHAEDHIINLLDRGVSTIVPFLVEGDPKVLVKTKIPSLRPFAYTTQLALEYFIKKLKFAENVLIPAATYSMFGLTVARTSTVYDRFISLTDTQIKTGTPYVDIIHDSCFIGDSSAKKISEFSFMGDVYKLPTVYAKDFFARKDRHGNQIADYITPDHKLHEAFSPSEITKSEFNRGRLSLRDYSTFIDLYLLKEMKHG